MGVYLSEPNREKKVNEGYKKGVGFCSVEMQGKTSFIQDGEEIWRMQQYAYLILEMETHYLQFLMDMEVFLFFIKVIRSVNM